MKCNGKKNEKLFLQENGRGGGGEKGGENEKKKKINKIIIFFKKSNQRLFLFVFVSERKSSSHVSLFSRSRRIPFELLLCGTAQAEKERVQLVFERYKRQRQRKKSHSSQKKNFNRIKKESISKTMTSSSAIDPAAFNSSDFDPSKWVDALCASRPEGESMEK